MLSLMGKNVGVRLCLNKPFCAGHRLISINSTSLEGVSQQAALEILENAPEDVTLVISQPKDRLSKGRDLHFPCEHPQLAGNCVQRQDEEGVSEGTHCGGTV